MTRTKFLEAVRLLKDQDKALKDKKSFQFSFKVLKAKDKALKDQHKAFHGENKFLKTIRLLKAM